MKNSQKSSVPLIIIIAFLLVIIGGGIYMYLQQMSEVIQTENSSIASEKLLGRFVLKDSTCAGLEFDTDSSIVIWRNEIECLISDTNPDYYHIRALFWLDSKTFVVKDTERRDLTLSPKVDVYVLESYSGNELTLKSLWTGWGDYKFDKLEFVKK